MTKYNVHIYREMRLVFQDIEAETPEQAAETCRDFPAEEACGPAVDCDGETFSALVDVQGDLDCSRSVTVDFPPERQRKAAPALLEALTLCWEQLSLWVVDIESCDLSPEDDAALTKGCSAIAEAKADGISRPPTVLVEVIGGIAKVTATPCGINAVIVDWDTVEIGDDNYVRSVIDEVKGSSLEESVKADLLVTLEQRLTV